MYSNRGQNGYGYGGGGIPSANTGGSGRSTATVNVLGLRVPKKVAVGILAASGLLALMGPDLDFSFDPTRRLKLATTCIHNIYVDDFGSASLMPSPPERDSEYVPVHIKMCYEWLRRDALGVDDAIMHRVNILEHEDVCLDWAAPHYSMMEIIANSILHTVLPRIRYRHGCPAHRIYEENKRGYDWSPFQTVLQEPAMAVNQDLVFPELFLEQCKYCLETYDPTLDAARIRSRSFHHCFAFPEESSMYVNPTPIETLPRGTPVPLPAQPDPAVSTAPISAVLRPLRARLVHSAAEWVNVTDAPPREKTDGTVILIDPGTLGISPDIIKEFIEPSTTSISIIAGPECYAANLPTGQNCAAYGEELRDRLRELFPDRDTNGFENGHGIDFQISASTAGTLSRAILADELLCPPKTATCLLPPVGKPPNTHATLLGIPCPDCPGSGVPEVKFFENVGTNGNTDVILLPDPVDPPVVEGTPDMPAHPDIPQEDPDTPVSPNFPNIQKPTVGDGFPKELAPLPSPPNLADLPTIPSSQVYKDAEDKLPPSVGAASTGTPEENSPLENTPNVHIDHSNTPGIPSAEDIQNALDNNEPLDTNTPFNPPEEPPEPVDPTKQTELATDESAGLDQNTLDDENYKKLAVERRNSKDRIITGFDGNYLFEVPCPDADDNGNVVITDDGYAITDNGDTVVVSDGFGTVTFESPVNITTVEEKDCDIYDPITGVTTTEKCVTIPDPLTGEMVNVTKTGKVGCDCDPDTIQVTDELGQLVTQPNTGKGCLLTMGDASRLKRKKPEGPKTYTIIEGKVLSSGNENIPPSFTGTVVMGPGGGYAVTQQTDDFNGFQHVSPLDGTTGNYQAHIDIPFEEDILQVPDWDHCQINPPIPIMIIGQFGMTLVFDSVQTFKGGEVSWVATNWPDVMYGGEPNCIKSEEVPPGRMKNSRKFAMCKWKESASQYEAEIDYYVHDGSKKIGQDPSLLDSADPGTQALFDITPSIPAMCEPSQDYGNKCAFKYRVKCTDPYGFRRGRRLGEVTPPAANNDAKQQQQQQKPTEDSRILFAKNIVEKCPELGKPKVFDHYTFGGNAQNTRRIPVHAQGQKMVYPGRIARLMNGDDTALAE